jgi:hypothetical protein
MPEEGIPASLAEALALAETEMGVATPVETPEALPAEGTEEVPSDEQAPTEVTADHPETGKQEDSPASPLDLLKDKEAAEEVAAPIDWDAEVEIETVQGNQRVALKEMRNGYLRQADYTQKTQELARERELVADAVSFFGEFSKDPNTFARYLAVRAGLVTDTEAPQLEGVQLYTQADLEAAVDAKVEERIKEHPQVREAEITAQVAEVRRQFDVIEEQFKVDLTQDHKRMILQRAQKDQTANLPLVFQAMLYEASAMEQEKARLAGATTARPTRTPDEGDLSPPQKVESLEAAFALALEEVGG